VVLGSEALFQRFLAADYTSAQQTLEQSSARVEPLVEPAADPGVVERVRRWWAQGGDVGARLDALKALANDAVEHVIRLIVVFTLQTLVLPLALGWALWRLLRAAVGGPGR
jgi:hypothetical protein